MTKNLDLDGLQSIADNYDLFYIDLWGVIHNGVKLHNSAIATLNELKKKNKSFVLLTNAPRPNTTVNKFLEKMGMSEDLREHVFTSGEAALNFLKTSFKFKNFFHIGPPRDFDLFNEFKNNKSTELNESEYLLCTGLFDDHEDDLSYYKNLLEKRWNQKQHTPSRHCESSRLESKLEGKLLDSTCANFDSTFNSTRVESSRN